MRAPRAPERISCSKGGLQLSELAVYTILSATSLTLQPCTFYQYGSDLHNRLIAIACADYQTGTDATAGLTMSVCASAIVINLALGFHGEGKKERGGSFAINSLFRKYGCEQNHESARKSKHALRITCINIRQV